LLTTPPQALPDLVGATFDTAHSRNWGDSFNAVGTILNQGNATTTGSFNVEVFASTTPTITSESVPLGQVTIPAGLGPHQSAQFNQIFTLPPTPIPNYNNGNPIYIDLFINPNKQVVESNYHNNAGVGAGYDVSPIQITPTQPSLLVGSSLGVTPTAANWGQTITVTAQVRNNAQGDAPPTRARIALTPTGLNPGSAYDYTIGYLNIPTVPAWQTVNVSQQITLPAAPPSSLANQSQFTLSMAQDANFVTNPISPHVANQGAGLDMTPITITSTSSTPATPTELPDMAPSNVVPSAKTVFWGYNFQVSTTIQNLGQAVTGPFNVRLLMTGSDGSLAHAIYLGEATIPGLQPNTSQQLTQTVHLPNELPNGVSLSSVAVGRIAVLVDPDQAVDQALRSNDLAESGPVVLRVLGSDGSSTVPTSPAIGTTLGQPQPAGTIQTSTAAVTTTPPSAAATPPTASLANARARASTARAARAANLKLLRHAPAHHQSLTSKVEHQLKIFPTNVKNFVKDVINGKPVNGPSSSKKK
jgi:hypothetical protein